MRLSPPHSLAVLGLLFGLSCGAHTEPKDPIGLVAETGVGCYGNNDALTVISPWVSATKELPKDHVVDVKYTVDVITAASVDVVSSATQAFEETRHEGAVVVQGERNDIRGALAWSGSTESDARSNTVDLRGETDLFSKNLTIAAQYAVNTGKLGTVQESPDLWRRRTTQKAGLSATQILGRTTVGGLTYTYTRDAGLLSSPYRRAPIFPAGADTLTGDLAQWVAERHPDLRNRHAFTGSGRQAVGQHVFLRLVHRGYFDDWAMRAHTTEAGVAFDVTHGFVFELNNRFHWQSSVGFYRDIYTVNREFITRDRRLGQLWTESPGAALRYKGERLQAYLRGQLQSTHYKAFTLIAGEELLPYPDTLAVIGETGLSAAF